MCLSLLSWLLMAQSCTRSLAVTVNGKAASAKHQKQQQQQQLSATKATIRDSITKGKWHNGNRLLKLVCFGRASEVSGYLSCIWSALVVLLMILRNSPPASRVPC